MTTEHDPKDFPPAFEAEFADMDLTKIRMIVLAAWCAELPSARKVVPGTVNFMRNFIPELMVENGCLYAR